MPQGGDSWRPTSERHNDVSEKAPLVTENIELGKKSDRNGGNFWRRDQRDEDRGSGISRGSQHQKDHESPNISKSLDSSASIPRQRSRSFSISAGQQQTTEVPIRPTLQTRHTSHFSQLPVTSPASSSLLAGNNSLIGDKEHSSVSTTIINSNSVAAMVTRDPRLKNRDQEGTKSQHDSFITKDGVCHIDSAAEWEILKSLSTVEAERISLENEGAALDKQLIALKNELRVFQFPGHAAYSKQIADRAKLVESQKASISSKVAASTKKAQELQSSFMEARQSRDSTLSTRIIELHCEQTKRMRQEQGDVATQQKSLATQFDMQAKAFTELSAQVRTQAELIQQLQKQNEQLKDMAMENRVEIPESPPENRQQLAELQDMLDPVLAQIKEQKLAIAKLNEVFVPLSSFKELETRLQEIKKPLAGTETETETVTTAYITRDDFKPYIDNFNQYAGEVEGHLNKIMSRLDALESSGKTSSDKDRFATKDELDHVRLELQSEQSELITLSQKIVELDTKVKDEVINHNSQTAKVQEVFEIAEVATKKIDGLANKIQSLEARLRAQTSAEFSLNTLPAGDQEKLRQVLSLRKDFDELHKKVSHSIKSLSERWNNLRTDDLARRILATLNPTISSIKPHVAQLQQQYQELQPVKEIFELHKQKMENQATELGTQFSDLLKKSTQLQETFQDLQTSNSSLVTRLGTIEANTDSVKKDIGQVHSDIMRCQSADQSTRRDLEAIAEDFRSKIETVQNDFRSDHAKLTGDFRQARDSIATRVEVLETRDMSSLVDRSNAKRQKDAISQETPDSTTISKLTQSSDNSGKPRSNAITVPDESIRIDITPGPSEAHPAKTPKSSQDKNKNKRIKSPEKPSDRKSMRDIWGPAAKLGRRKTQSSNIYQTLGGTRVRHSRNESFSSIEILDDEIENDSGNKDDRHDDGDSGNISSSAATGVEAIDITDPRNWQKDALSRLKSGNFSESESSLRKDDNQNSSTIEVAVEKLKRKRDRSSEDPRGRKPGRVRSSPSRPEKKHKKKKT